MKKGRFKLAIISLILGVTSLCMPLIASNFGGGVHLLTLGGRNAATAFSSGENGQISGSNDDSNTSDGAKNTSAGETLSGKTGNGISVLPEILCSTNFGQNLKSSIGDSGDLDNTEIVPDENHYLQDNGFVKEPEVKDVTLTNSNVTLNQDTTITSSYEFSVAGNYTFDLNGYNLTIGSAICGIVLTDSIDITLTIKNSSTTLSTITFASSAQGDNAYVAKIMNKNKLIIEGDNIVFDMQQVGGRRLVYSFAGGSLTLNGNATYKGFRSYSAIKLNSSTLEINGGTFADNTIGGMFFVSLNSSIKVTGGDFSGNLYNYTGTTTKRCDLMQNGTLEKDIAEGVEFIIDEPFMVIDKDYTFTSNQNIQGRIEVIANCTINLNGYTLTNSSNPYNNMFRIFSRKVTIKGGNDTTMATIYLGYSQNSAFAFDASSSDLTVENLNIIAQSTATGFNALSTNFSISLKNVKLSGFNQYSYVFTGSAKLTLENVEIKNCTNQAINSWGIVEIKSGTFSNNGSNKGGADIVSSGSLTISDGVSIIVLDVGTDGKSIITPTATAQTVEYNKGESFKPSGTDGNGNTVTTGYTVKYRKAGTTGSWSTDVPTTLGTYDVYLYRAKTSSNSTVSRVLSSAFVVEPQKVSVPTFNSAGYTYNGSVQTPTPTGFDASIMDITYANSSSTNAGTYKATISLKDKTNYTWSDGTTADITIEYTINKANNNITINYKDFTYGSYSESTHKISASATNGTPTIVIKNSSGTTITDISTANAGTYTITATVGESTNYLAGTQTATLTISKAKINKPTAISKEYTYTGKTITFDTTGYDSTTMSISGSTSGTNAGTYYAYITPKDNYTWQDGTTTEVKFTYTIKRIVVTPPTISNLVYNGSLQKANVSETDLYKVHFNSGGTNVGTYNVYLLLKDYTNYVWDTNGISTAAAFGDYDDFISASESELDGLNESQISIFGCIRLTYQITPATVTVPSLEKSSFVYTGSAITPTITNGTQTGMTVSGTQTATNVGTYTITFTLDSNHQWATTFSETLTWSITKGTNTWTTNPGISGWVYGEYSASANTPVGVSKWGTVSFTYRKKGTTTEISLDNIKTSDAGTYELVATVPANGENYDQIQTVVEFTITRKELEKPVENKTEFVYNKTEQTYTLTTSDYYTISNNKRTIAGSQQVKIELINTTNYCWVGGTDTAIYYTFTITPAKLTKPTASVTTFTYNGKVQSLSLTNFDENTMTKSGDSAIVVGSYTATFKLKDKDNYTWADGSTTDVTLAWSIAQASNKINSLTFAGWTYGGTPSTPSVTADFGATTVKYTYKKGDTTLSSLENLDAGTYTITATIEATTNYAGATKTQEFVVSKVVLNQSDLPTIKTTSFVYTGLDHTITLQNEKTYLSVTGTKTAKEVGTYTLTVSISDTTNYEFATGVNTTLTWSITQATTEITDLAITGWVYGKYDELANAPSAKTNFGEITYYYVTRGATTYTESNKAVPTDAGSYTLIAVVEETTNYTKATARVDFEITKATLTKPTLGISTAVYTGENIEFKPSNIVDSKMENIGDKFTQVNAKTYKAIIKLTDSTNYTWADGSSDNVEITFTITQATVTVPSLEKNSFVYTGSEITPEITNGTQTGMTASGETSGTNVGTYTITFTLDANHKWADNSTTTKTLEWSITEKSVALPTVKGTYTYNKSLQTLVLENFNESIMSITGNTGTNAGTYTAKVTLTNSNYKWATTFDGNISWEIGKQEVEIPTFSAKMYQAGETQKADETLPEGAVYTITKNDGGIEVGEYDVILTLSDTNNYYWKGDSTKASATATAKFKITNSTITKPQADETAFTYTGSEQIYNIPENAGVYTIDGNKQTNAGTYTVTVTLANSNYTWEDGSKEPLTFEFKINKATDNSITKLDLKDWTYGENVSKLEVSAKYPYTTSQITITYVGVGNDYSSSEKPQNAGKYKVVVAVSDTTNFNSCTDEKEFEILKKVVTKPTEDSTNFVYNGNPLTYNIAQSEYYTISGDTTKTNAGSYEVTVSLNNVDGQINYVWDDETTDNLTYNFTISPKTVTAPSENANTFTYNGNPQTYLANGTDYTVENGTKTDAGSYVVTISLNDKANFVWSTGGTEDITYTFTIHKAEVDVPSAGSKKYTGETLTSDLTSTSDYDVTENDGGTAIGSYDVKLKLTEDKFKNYKWKGYAETTQEITIKFTIAGTENGWEIEPSISGFEYGKFDNIKNAPKGEATFGDVTFTFFVAVDGEKTGEALSLEQIKTADAGNYIMVATVPAGEGNAYAELRKEVAFTISKQQLTAPTKVSKTYTYIKDTSQALELEGFEDTLMDIAGNTGTNATSYKAIITIKENLKKNYEWKGEATQIEIDWEILKQKLAIPTINATQDLTYTGNEITLVLDNFQENLMEVSGNKATNVHESGYTAVVTLKDPDNYEWDGTFDGNIEWNIQKAKAEITNLTITGWTYNKTNSNAVTPTANTNFGKVDYYYVGINGTSYESSTVVPTNAGTYQVIAKVSGSDNWEEATELRKEFTISPFKVTKPTKDNTNFVFNGNPQTYNIAQSEYYTISGDTTKTNAGSSDITISLNDKDNTVWDDETSSTGNLTYSFEIAKKKVTAPTANNTNFVYNGTEQTYLEDGTDYTVTGGKRTDAGSQDVTISLKDKDNTEWSTGGTDDITYNFTISKAEVKIAESTTEITEGETGSFSVGTLPAEVSVTIKYAPAGTESWSENVPMVVGSYDVKLVFTASSKCVNYKSSEQVIRTGFVIKQKAIAPVEDKEPTTVEKEDHGIQIGLIISAIAFGLIALIFIISGMVHHYWKKENEQSVKEYYILHPEKDPDRHPELYADLDDDKKKKKKKSKETSKEQTKEPTKTSTATKETTKTNKESSKTNKTTKQAKTNNENK